MYHNESRKKNPPLTFQAYEERENDRVQVQWPPRGREIIPMTGNWHKGWRTVNSELRCRSKKPFILYTFLVAQMHLNSRKSIFHFCLISNSFACNQIRRNEFFPICRFNLRQIECNQICIY